jgi:hypothetical protein
MGRIVNAVAKAALDWQPPIVWIRVNIGYMRVEVDDIENKGQQVADVQALLSRFDDAFSGFAQAELAVFKAARQAELHTWHPSNSLVQALQLMRDSLLPWLGELKSLVTHREKTATDLTLALLHSLGAEILNAHEAFRNTVQEYGDQLASDSP